MMARTRLTITNSSEGGTDLVYSPADALNGNLFENSGNDYLLVENNGTASTDVTIISVPCSHGRTQDEVKTVAASSSIVVGPFARSLFNQSSSSDIFVDFTADTNIQVAVIRR